MNHASTVVIAPQGGPTIPARLDRPAVAAAGLAVLVHGRDGSPETAPIAAMRAALLRRGWAVVAPQLRFSRADPASGEATAFTMGGCLDDVRAVREWAAGAGGRLAYAGHSMGAWAAALAATEGPAPAFLLAVAPVVSGDALLAARRRMGPEALDALAREVPRAAAEWPGRDARPALRALAAPVGVVVGALDGLTPPEDAKSFFDGARAPRFFAVLPGQHHCPEGAPLAPTLDAALAALDG